MNKLQITLLSILGMATACTNDIDESATELTGKAVIVQASIGKAQSERAAANSDGISYSSFASNDEIGLFSQDGLKATNEKLTSENSTFKSEKLNWVGGNASNVYAYFPYSEDQDSKTEGVQIKIWKNDNNRFDDILTANVNNIAEGIIINMAFKHRFAQLIVKRGKGFDKVNATNSNKDLTVSLNHSIASNATINYPIVSDKDFVALQKDDTSDGHKDLGTTTVGDDYYVIIPVGKVGDETNLANVESITLYNDLGRKMTVPYSISKLESGKKYTVTVIMRDNNAVVSPTEIIQWDDEEVKIEKPAGIENVDQFIAWEAAYNTADNDGKRGEKLAKYGSYDGTKWTFRLLNDIDFSPIDKEFNGITKFTDIFDGQGHTINGIIIKEDETTGTKPTGFVRTLLGEIKRLILKDATIYGNLNVGGFAGKAESGAKVTDCHLTGASIIFGSEANSTGAYVGGDGTYATITGCTTTPTVIIKSSN